MTVFNTNVGIVFVVIFVYLKEFYSPPNPSEYPPPVIEVYTKREICEEEIAAVFSDEENAYQYFKTAFKTLTIGVPMGDHARTYYGTFCDFIEQGEELPSITNYCIQQAQGDETFAENCEDQLGVVFGYEGMDHVIYNALYNINQEIVDSMRVVEKFDIELEPEQKPCFLNAYEFCIKQVKMPTEYKPYDVYFNVR